MTTIILVAIGVLIAAASALAVLYFGGNAFGVNETRAEAARLVNEGAQITYATDLFYKERERMPGQGITLQNGETQGQAALRELLSEKYLNQVPTGATLTNHDTWQMEYGDDGLIYTRLGRLGEDSEAKALDVCREARRQLVLPKVTTTATGVYKCDGSDYPDARWATLRSLPDREPCCIR